MTDRSRGRRAALAATTIVGAAGVVAGVRVVRDEQARKELARARSFAARVQAREQLPPVPPPLPPGHVVELPGRGETFVRDTGGDGAPVVLLHGWSASGDLNFFSAFEPLRAAGHRVLTVDHRGHGRGMRSEEDFTFEACADDVAAVLDVLDLPPAAVVGYSMGGPIAMYVAARHRPAVSGIVLAATALEWRATLRERVVWRAFSTLELAVRTGTADGIVERALRDMVDRRPDLAPLVPWIGAELRRGDPRVFMAAGRALGRHDARPWVERLAGIPAVVLVTTEDRLVRPVKQRELARALGADVVELDADHDAPALAQEAFGAALVEAVGRLGVSRPDVGGVAVAGPAGTAKR